MISFTRFHYILLGAVGGLLLILSFVYMTQVIQPERTALSQQEEALEHAEERTEDLQEQRQEAAVDESVLPVSEKRKLPADPAIDDLMMDIEQAQGMSGAYVLYVDVAEGAPLAPADGEVPEEENEAPVVDEDAVAPQTPEEADEENDEEQGSEQGGVPAGASVTEAELVDGVEALTVEMSVRSADYFGLSSFLHQLDSLQRLLNIEYLYFDGQDERVSIDDETDPLEFTVVASTYYFPQGAEVAEEAPVHDFLPPVNKDNPILEEGSR
ncbi:hypothetical protein B0H94_10929 [Salsuginibacillus halophilus]|uniref:Type IV pilus assembly protein PilO n=1 Tax=Salsuginibacillus halophilus TaxID=517424 RepID=A0A2P8HCL1_9BACI|nr:hypothetical protein [Salsuginibacillus halophilus]PSL43974.1 hypothetical protein B0H94_10929 [Salsuginibacillus halophilus]